MDFFSSLLKAYERAELEGLVDQHGDKDEPVLLPLFHESKKAAKNIVNVTLNKEGEVLTAEWLDDGTRIIFPVTPASVTRTAKPERLVANSVLISEWSLCLLQARVNVTGSQALTS